MVALAVEHITETQRLDISISREWLHVLAWQMGVSNGLIGGQKESGMRLEYPVELARRVVRITEEANPMALDSHGIGMEQKLSDVGSCLADVLRCTAGDMSATFIQGREYLHLLVNKVCGSSRVDVGRTYTHFILTAFHDARQRITLLQAVVAQSRQHTRPRHPTAYAPTTRFCFTGDPEQATRKRRSRREYGMSLDPQVQI